MPLTKTGAQVRLGLNMPGLEPRAAAALVAPVPMVMPGQTLTFTDPDAVSGAANPAFVGGADFAAGATPLRAFAYTIAPLQSSSASAFQYNDFAIPESTVVGGVTDSVVSAQISGSVSVRGFLFAMGAAEAKAGVDVEVLDITDTNAPVMVNSKNIANYEADDRLSPSVGGGVDADGEGGFPFAGVIGGGEIDAALQMSPILNFVRDDATFGFTALLRRGHVYRLQTELSVDTSERVFGGTAIASFYSAASGGPVIPNVFDPDPTSTTKGTENSWLSLLTPMAGSVPDLQMRKGSADVVSEKYLGIPVSVWNSTSPVDSVLKDGLGFISSDESAKNYSGYSLFSLLFAAPPLSIGQLVKNSPFLAVRNESGFETIPLPGVAVAGPTITLGNDPIELAEQSADRAIEEHLSRNDVLVSLYLPAAFGGELEQCTSLVSHLIDESNQAGYSTRDAEKYLVLAVEAKGQGRYKLAYEQLHEAYQRLTAEPRREAGNP